MKLLTAAAALLAFMASPAFANLDLAKKNACMACHAVDKKIVGPAFKDIAAKYAAEYAADSLDDWICCNQSNQ